MVMKMEVCLNLKELLEKEGRTKYWLVKELETSYPVINKMIEDTAVGIQLDTIGRLCQALNCTPNDLIKIKYD